jgi:hypothetical protein
MLSCATVMQVRVCPVLCVLVLSAVSTHISEVHHICQEVNHRGDVLLRHLQAYSGPQTHILFKACNSGSVLA